MAIELIIALTALVFLITTIRISFSFNEKSSIIRVVDGDTIEIKARYLPDAIGDSLSLRIIGIDTPERGGRAKCELEADLAEQAKTFVEQQIYRAMFIRIELDSWDKYGGRVLGDVVIDGKKLSKLLMDKGYAVVYEGKGKKHDWCRTDESVTK